MATFSANLDTLPEAAGHPDTMAWWARHPEAWQASRVDPRPPLAAMLDYVAWLDGLPGQPVFVGYPASFDFMFVYWHRFSAPNSISAARGSLRFAVDGGAVR